VKLWLPYRDLTPLHDGWGWGSRVFEIFCWTLSYVFVAPFVLLSNGVGRLLERMWR